MPPVHMQSYLSRLKKYHKKHQLTVNNLILPANFPFKIKNMYRVIIVFLLLVPATGFSQLYINKTKSHVKREVSKYISENDSITTNITETDSTLLMTFRGAGATEADHIYNFDKSGKCSSEKTITWCDSCLEKLLQPLLAEKKYEWKKINLNQYVAKFSAGIFLEMQISGDIYSFTIFRITLTKEMYTSLFENN